MLYQKSIFPAVLLFANRGSANLPPQGTFSPDLESAVRNAPQIFNAIYGAMRQWPSSIAHNGMSFFRATIPTGTVLYHGAGTADVPESYEWIAFEIEHSENFAGTWKRRPKGDESPAFQSSGQKPLTVREISTSKRSDWDPDNWIREPGYLQIYQAARPLNVLYIDGMSAGKTNMGTNDAEDYILTGNKSRHGAEDWPRVIDLCKWAKDWQIDGFIRMEPGFELVYCEFRDGGIHQVSANRRPDIRPTVDLVTYVHFEWLKAASQRYYGIGGSRVIVDYSSMVSVFFYPLNLTNPNSTVAEHPRLLSATESQLASIRHHVERMMPKQREKSAGGIDWQGVTDMVVARYADRLAFMSTIDSVPAMNMSLLHLLETYIDHSNEVADYNDAQQNCAAHYLAGVVPSTPEDELIFAGISRTLQIICQSLFRAYEVIVIDPNPTTASLDEVLSSIRGLMEELRWSKWKECGPCKTNEICFVAMWPFGNTEDHYHPSCQNASTVFNKDSYWRWSFY